MISYLGALTGNPRAAWLTEGDILSEGSSGDDVRSLQQFLRDGGFMPSDATIDGQFGPITKTAVQALQGDLGVDTDGAVGPRTRAAVLRQLTAAAGGGATSSVGPSTAASSGGTGGTGGNRAIAAALLLGAPVALFFIGSGGKKKSSRRSRR